MSVDMSKLWDKASDIASDNNLQLPPAPTSMFEWKRFPGGGKGNRNRAAGVMLLDDRVCIVDHSRDVGFAVFPDRDHTVSAIDRRMAREAYEKAERARQRRQCKERVESFARLEKALQNAITVEETPYTRRKQIQTHGVPYLPYMRCLAFPLCDINGHLRSAQRVYDDGSKRLWPRLPTKGAFFLFGSAQRNKKLLLCEGPSTAATLHEQTDLPVACAMYAGNLLPVAEAFRRRHPDMSIVICGDDDRNTTGNPGRTKAEEAARATGARTVFPVFPEGVEGTDFNDMHLHLLQKRATS